MTIPRQVFFYWGGFNLPFLRYLSIASFAKFNPDWQITLYTPKFPVQEWSWTDHWCNKPVQKEQGFNVQYLDTMFMVERLPGVKIVQFDFDSIGYPNGLSEVHKSDVIRLWLLKEYGGLWSDIDILYFKPVANTFQEDTTASFCYREGGVGGPAYHSVGYLAGAPGNQYYRTLWENLKKNLDTRIYQSAGSYFFSKHILPDHNSITDPQYPGLYNIPIEVVYPYRVPACIFKDPASVTVGYIQEKTCGLHWYGGAPDAMLYQGLMTADNWNKYDNLIFYLIKKYMYP
jgi:hypothetical protein